MVVIWGRKRSLSALGRVAYFCSICRELRPHRLLRVGSAAHVYYVPLGRGELVGHLARCEVCESSYQVDADEFTNVSRDGRADLERLIAETCPDLPERAAERLELERRARRGDLTPDERSLLLDEPFQTLNWEVEVRAAETHFDRQSCLGCLGTIGAVLLLGTLALAVEGPTFAVLAIAVLAAGVLGLGYTFYSLIRDPRRFARQRVYPRLALALRPLRPSAEELADVVARMRTLGLALAKRTRAQELWTVLERTGEAAPIEPR